MWTELLSAVALVFILEGILPFVNPDAMKKVFLAALQMDNTTLRFVGISSMLFGVLLLYIVR